ncbi:hypothetical protein F8M41_014861 [Gigaspora margarita]|uniref:Uncharacterized protein n=1 Tax=Gigaspora margarita TaxID=4874 RepID=A0A8H4AR70_GIGMA|nr:hypothetical protein F8M41_014861 [Gigaspora margarita]
MSNENENTRYAVGSEFKPERDNGHLRGPCTIILESIQLFRWIDLNVNNAQAIRDLGEEIRDLKRKLVENREERDNKRPNDNNNNNNTPTPTTTSNTPTTTIPSTSTTSIPTTRTKSTTTFTFPDIPSHTTIDDTSTSTTTTTTTTILSKTTTNTNTITTNSSKPTDNIDLSKTTIPFIPPKPTSENYVSCPICKEELKKNKIEKHLKEHIKNPLSKETIRDKLKIKKQSTGFTRIKEIINKITDIRVKKNYKRNTKLIETYGKHIINYISEEMKEQILYNFDKIMVGVIGSIIRF